MKKYNIVKLKYLKEDYKNKNLTIDLHGIVVEIFETTCKVLFFNKNNIGDYALVNVDKNDLLIEETNNLKNELIKKLETINFDKKHSLTNMSIKENDFVELTVENEKYSKYGIHKDDTGCVISKHAIKNQVEIDFSRILPNGTLTGSSIIVDIKDLKVIE